MNVNCSLTILTSNGRRRYHEVMTHVTYSAEVSEVEAIKSTRKIDDPTSHFSTNSQPVVARDDIVNLCG